MTQPDAQPPSALSAERIVADSLLVNMPLRMSPLGLAQEALSALNRAGYVLICARADETPGDLAEWYRGLFDYSDDADGNANEDSVS